MTDMYTPPSTVDDLVLPDAATEKRVRQYADGKRHGNIILHGPTGTGKSTTARVIAETRNHSANSGYPVPIYNGATFAQTDFNRIYNDWNWQRINGVEKPYVIIDEVDKLSVPLQHQLRAILDETSIGNVILTTNHIHRLDGSLVNRCDDIELPPIHVDDWKDLISGWLAEHQIDISSDTLNAVLSTNNGTIRDLKRAVEDIICDHK